MRRRLLSLAAGAALLFPVVLAPAGAGAAGARLVPAAGPAAPAPAAAGATLQSVVSAPNPQVPGEYEPVAETPGLRMYVNRADSKLIVEDRRNGKLWSSNPLRPLSDQKTILDDAVFQLNYTNARRQMTNLASSASERPELSLQKIEYGVRVIYDIQKLKLKITADYSLKEEPRGRRAGDGGLPGGDHSGRWGAGRGRLLVADEHLLLHGGDVGALAPVRRRADRE